MFYHDKRLQFRVRVERPNPVFARALQQAIGGVEGEIRVCLQYLFQAWGARGPTKYRDMLLETGTEEIGHIEMLSTAVALNLERAPLSSRRRRRQNPVVGARPGGMNLRHILSAGLAAMPADANGVPFDCLAHLCQRQYGRRHVRQRRRRGDRPGARGAALRHDRRPRHEGHALGS